MLKYLFDVEFTDGSTYTQNLEDKSFYEPDKRSCFFDVMKAVECGRKIKLFLLSDGKNGFLVDLTDGHFEVNGVKFFMHEERDLTNFRIIFFRQHTHHFNQDNKEIGHEITYRVGWQANDKDGNNVQRVMEID